MNQNVSIAAVGDRDSVMLFKALGIEAVYVDDAHQTEKAIHRLAREGCAVIYITEQAAAWAPEAIERYS